MKTEHMYGRLASFVFAVFLAAGCFVVCPPGHARAGNWSDMGMFAPAGGMGFAGVSSQMTPGMGLLQNFAGFGAMGPMGRVGTMSYELVFSRDWSPAAIRLTGVAALQGGVMYWVHCEQMRFSPVRTCRLVLNGRVGNTFAVPANFDLVGWFSSAFGASGPISRLTGGFGNGFSGNMETSGEANWQGWHVRGKFRFWR